MRYTIHKLAPLRCILPLLGAVIAISATGCQVNIGGQTLPSPYYLDDDVQYFPAGPEFILSQEAIGLEAAEEELLAPDGQARRPGWTEPKWK